MSNQDLIIGEGKPKPSMNQTFLSKFMKKSETQQQKIQRK